MKRIEDLNLPTKRKILTAAREVFSEKGYDGASTSEIAKKAGVNKALLTYHFQSKENILKEVVRLGSEEAIERRNIIKMGTDPCNKESFEEYYEQMFSIMESREEIIRIIIIESLKGTDADTPLFEFMEPFLKGVVSSLNSRDSANEDMEKVLTMEMFMDAIPLFMFVALRDKWARYKNLDKRKLRKDFMDLFKDIYVTYFQDKYFSNK